MNFVNLTPHALSIFDFDGTLLTVLPSPSPGTVARASLAREALGSLPYGKINIPLLRGVYGPVTGVPAPKDDTVYIVSAHVSQALTAHRFDRADVLTPGEVLRDKSGLPIGCVGLECARGLKKC